MTVQLSDTTAAPHADEDDAASCASTQPWSQGRHAYREPRYRPGRRTKRRRKLVEQEFMAKRQRERDQADLEWDLWPSVFPFCLRS